jgi:hypothetical protein
MKIHPSLGIGPSERTELSAATIFLLHLTKMLIELKPLLNTFKKKSKAFPVTGRGGL